MSIWWRTECMKNMGHKQSWSQIQLKAIKIIFDHLRLPLLPGLVFQKLPTYVNDMYVTLFGANVLLFDII